MPRKLITANRRKIQKARSRQRQNLINKGWKYDGLWWHSPCSPCRYTIREATHIEELRKWASGESAFLKDHDHAVWVKKQEEDNKLISFEELSAKSKERQALKETGKKSCYE
jgi:hypothetical protein